MAVSLWGVHTSGPSVFAPAASSFLKFICFFSPLKIFFLDLQKSCKYSTES